jgi:hypothetical protein
MSIIIQPRKVGGDFETSQKENERIFKKDG